MSEGGETPAPETNDPSSDTTDRCWVIIPSKLPDDPKAPIPADAVYDLESAYPSLPAPTGYARPRHKDEVLSLPWEAYCQGVIKEVVAEIGPLPGTANGHSAVRQGAALHPFGVHVDPERWRLDAFTSGPPPPERLLLAPLFPLQTAGVLFGTGGVGKSMQALDLALAVARRAVDKAALFIGGPFGGEVPAGSGGAVLFITHEDSAAAIHRRASALDPDFTRAGLPLYVIPGTEIPGMTSVLVRDQRGEAALTDFALRGLPAFLDRIEAVSGHPVRLVILDPASYFLNADDNQAHFVAPLVMRLNQLAAQRDCSILMLGHVSKGMSRDEMSMRGSGAWIFNSRFAYGLTPLHPRDDRTVPKKVGEKINRLAWGCLVKANHSRAPINVMRLYLRCEATGRLIDITSRLEDQSEGAGQDPGHLLVEAIQKADAAGRPFMQAGEDEGLHARRDELPSPLSGWGRNKLQGLATRVLEAGLIERRADRCLGVALN